ncbi:hypothetical protein HanXRQr2_Chr16g0738391 [Helianthus annuus]|uniref:Uncharacterized protein n=1 Tax=Helianthus annuus TaxID=4232 RepID=A0A9K3DR79_HELAN|nr:hypothetical protein HanXRQr2_Chr16g0738391 [Helianthus annuus]KAJ0437431.1 hypothetical protein HanHA300_Chr16g0602081 [Helianthus annuus]KAJ0459751.1 hypothetical protein HanHA89_Chr16g0652621 [Helianthus annuus]
MGINSRRGEDKDHYLQVFSGNLQPVLEGSCRFFLNLHRVLSIFEYSNSHITMTADDVTVVEEAGGPLPPLKWDQGLFKQVFRGQQFAPEWDARYPSQGQNAADAPSGFITLYADFFGEGNFRLPATHFLVRIWHFEFVCRSKGDEPTVDKFRVFYQLQSNLGFFSFALRAMKKILITPPLELPWLEDEIFLHP